MKHRKAPYKCADCPRMIQRRKKCDTCRCRDRRRRDPLKDAYNNLKSNAKRRGKFFDLTFEDFKLFAIRTEYIPKSGVTKHSWSIDRIDSSRGYTKDNIQVLTISQNSRKGIKKVLEYNECAEGLRVRSIINRRSYVPSEQPF